VDERKLGVERKKALGFGDLMVG